MRILQIGVPRSGNLWLSHILQESAACAGLENERFIRDHPFYRQAVGWTAFESQADIDLIEIESQRVFFRKGAAREEIRNLEDYLSRTSHVWTHSPWSDAVPALCSKFDRVVYIIRDPRDVALSASRFVFSPFMRAQHPISEIDPEGFLQHRFHEQLLTWVYHVGGYLQHVHELDIHVVFYERLLADLESEMGDLLKYLDISLSPMQCMQIRDRVKFGQMKKKNPDHLHFGTWGQWVTELDQTKKQQAQEIAGPLLALLGYPLDEEDGMAALPGLPVDLNPAKLTEAVRRSRGGLRGMASQAFNFARSKRPLREKVGSGLAYLFGRGRWKIS